MDYIKEKLYQQLAIDYCCQISDIKDDKNNFMKVLVTGFDPFGGESVNPAYEAVKLLPDIIEGAQIIKLEIPPLLSLEVLKNKHLVHLFLVTHPLDCHLHYLECLHQPS